MGEGLPERNNGMEKANLSKPLTKLGAWFRECHAKIGLFAACSLNDIDAERDRIRLSHRPGRLERWLERAVDGITDKVARLVYG